MSRLCILVFQNPSHNALLERMLQEQIQKRGLGVFLNPEYDEPFLTEMGIDGSSLICSIADNQIYDNCEMLLLPDHCKFNSMTNPVMFRKRMELLRDIFEIVLDYTDIFDLFICDSGANLNDLEHHIISLDSFLLVANVLNSINSPDMHFTICHKETTQ